MAYFHMPYSLLSTTRGSMRIQEIEIDNFKSFKNPTKIPFLPGFTAVSGPNGSGKSNIIDSILFCLGLSNSRTLRAEKLTDLINNQNTRREARVNIRFGASEKNEKDESSFEVGRRIKESDNGYQSTYYLNGKPCTLGDLHNKLALHHVSPHGYNVVMQGDVTRIISMTGFERRRIIDEMAGVAEFDSRVDLAHRELEKVNEQHERSSLILDEIAHRLIQLQAERDHAIRYRSLTSERDRCEAQNKLSACWELRQKIEGLLDMMAAAGEKKKQIEGKIEITQGNLAEKKADYERVNEEIREKGGGELLSAQEALEEARAGMEREKATSVYLHARRQELLRQEAKDEENKGRAILKKEDLLRQSQDLLEQQERYLVDLEAARKEFEELQEAILAIYQANEETSKQTSELRARLNETKDRYNEILRERMRTEDAANRTNERLVELKEQLKGRKDNVNLLKGEVERLEAEGQKNQENLKRLDNELNDHLERKRHVQAKLNGIEGEAENSRSEYHRVEARMKASEESSFGRAVETILRSGLSGLHGTLAQLGSADDRYSHALEIAGGGKLRFIVCDDDHVASLGIHYLKEQRAGRATFLPLNKLQKERVRPSLREKGFLGYAIDLLRFDEKYADAFAFAFGETAVFDTLENARPHMGRYRMVTLDGELLERSGAMTGGSDGKAGLRFTASLAKELEEAKVRLASVLGQLSKCKEEISRIDWGIEEARGRREKCSDLLRSSLLEIADRKRRREEHQEEISKIEEAIAGAKDEEKKNKNQVEVLSEKMIEHDEILNDLELALSELEDSLAESRIEELNGKSSNAEYQLKALEAKRKNAEIDQKGILFQLERNEENLQEIRNEQERRKATSEKLLEEERENKTKQAAFDRAYGEAMMKRESLREQLGELNQARDNAIEAIRSAEREAEEVKREAVRLEEGMASTESQVAERKTELSLLEDNLWLSGIEPPTAPVGETTAELGRKITSLSERLRLMEPVNMLAIEEFDSVAARSTDLQAKLDLLREERLQLLERIDHFALLKKQTFMETFDKVASNFLSIFHELSKGTGSLVLENPEDPFCGGLIIKAQPQDKKMLRLEAMSGGEKSLTALAFVFSLQRVNPAPFYALDEVDMMLDGVNAELLAEMIRQQTDSAQLIVVSHRKPMLTRADQTIGVSARADGVSKVTGVKWSA
ncbi:MAG TPA: chromosome segregation protein SMC [Cyanobacteria bacterium UBA8530]|nr:chromosome segregation protein SMC [Cyanobacteria bacterium UBA8530]